MPPMPHRRTSVFVMLTVVILGFGVAFPLTGFAILAMLVIDQLITAHPLSPETRILVNILNWRRPMKSLFRIAALALVATSLSLCSAGS